MTATAPIAAFPTRDEAMRFVISQGCTLNTGYGRWANAEKTLLLDAGPISLFHHDIEVYEVEDAHDRRWFAKHGHKKGVRLQMAREAKKWGL